MKTIAFVARKGGVAKTTLAAHLAVFASVTQPVTLVDIDRQGSLALWWKDRPGDNPTLLDVEPRHLPTELAKVKAERGLVIIDTPAMDTVQTTAVIRMADLIVIPCTPSKHDLRGVTITVAEVKKARKPFAFVLTKAITGTGLTMQAQEALREVGPLIPTTMHQRVSYAGSMSDGLTVLDVEPNGRAAAEMVEICKAIFKAL